MENPFAKSDPLSPCIQVCRVDHSEKYCVGCRRSLLEIANWWKYSEEEKQQVLDALKTRVLPAPGED